METRGLLPSAELSLHISFLEIKNCKKCNNNTYNLSSCLKFQYLCSFSQSKPTRCTISQIYFWLRTVHVSDRSTVHHQEFQHRIHSNKCISYWLFWLSASEVRILTSLEDTKRTSMTNTYCCVYSDEILLMMDSRSVRNMYSSLSKINLRNNASRWLLLQEYITMHGLLNVKYLCSYLCTGIKICSH